MPDRQRQKAYRNLAAENDMSYHFGDDEGLRRQLADFKLLNQGWRGRISHHATRQEGLLRYELHLFDYTYLRSYGKNAKRVSQTVIFCHSQQLMLSEFYLRPETFLHTLAELVGFPDIDFPEDVKFSRQYRLTGPDEEMIRHQFQPEVLHFFALEKGWAFEGLGFYFLLYRRGQLAPAGDLPELYRTALRLFEMLRQDNR